MKSSSTFSEKMAPSQLRPTRGSSRMKMELIQPFINAADAVLSQGLQGTNKVDRLALEELAYQVVGNAVCALNDQGFHFRVHPPMLVTCDEGDKTSEDTEALMICFETSLGNVYMNVALRYNKRRMSDHAVAGR